MTETREVPGLSGYLVDASGDVFSVRCGARQKLSARPHKGYLHVQVRLGVGRKTRVKCPVHQMVLLAFKGDRPSPSHESRHLDGDPSNNTPSNLEWGTHAANMADAIRHGTHASLRRGEAAQRAKLSDADIRDIRLRVAQQGETQTAIAGRYGISQKHVSRIKLCRTRITA